MLAFRWAACYNNKKEFDGGVTLHYEAILQHIKTSYEAILDENLVGIYVHGSIAFGCFDPRVSDIDFLVVVKDALSVSIKKQLLETLLELTPHCPQKGLEMSVVLARNCRPFVYPTPYEFHFSNAHIMRAKRDPDEYCANFHGTDQDLAACFTPLYTTKTWGTGLGLPYCRAVMANMHGTLEFMRNDNDQPGCCVRLTFPITGGH